MRNHDQKTKDMIASVLPSAARKSARKRRRLAHQARRAREAQALHQHWRADRIDDYAAADAKFVMDMLDLVWDRRAADKIGPLTHWAARRVARDPELCEAPLADQVEAFRAILPNNLIGRHALQHIEWALGWESRQADWSPNTYRSRAEATSRERVRVMTVQVHRILANGRHAELNRGIKMIAAAEASSPPTNRRCPPAPRRLLRGTHDVDEFVRDVQASDPIRALIAELAA